MLFNSYIANEDKLFIYSFISAEFWVIIVIYELTLIFAPAQNKGSKYNLTWCPLLRANRSPQQNRKEGVFFFPLICNSKTNEKLNRK